MRIAFYDGNYCVDVPDDRLIGVFSPKPVEGGVGANIIYKALSEPINTSPLEDMRGDRVLILVDDITRTTPVHKILPEVVGRLPGFNSIEILIAQGTHRPMTMTEKLAKLGNINTLVHDHDFRNPETLKLVGYTSSGMKAEVNKLLTEVDLIVGIGQIVPHRVAGFSGGAKIVQPGVCSEETTGTTHWLSAQYSGEEILGVVDNPVRREIEEVGKLAGLSYIVNVVQNSVGIVVDCVAGDPFRAHRRGCESSLERFRVDIPAKADVVILDSSPADLELWQAAKAIYASELAVKDGGTVILITPCPEGVATQHRLVSELGYMSFHRIKSMVENGELSNLTVAAHIAHVGRVSHHKARVIIVSSGIDRETAMRLGLLYSPSLKEALSMALSFHNDPSILVLKNGGHILPCPRR